METMANAGTGNAGLINDGGTRANAVKAGLTSNEVDHQPQLDARDKEIEVDPLTESLTDSRLGLQLHKQ